ncbi:uncharacterized protein [Nicotiana sylvestris]|uniref:uncharacterized protein n=1 Tax=Nicotiana sylvestris TaxID=4096 RepID=UPI00388C44B9
MREPDKEPDAISSLAFRVTSQMSGSIVNIEHMFPMLFDFTVWFFIVFGGLLVSINWYQSRLGTRTVPKTRKEYNDADRKVVEKNFKAKKIIVCSIGPDKCNHISACEPAKKIWEALQMDHEGTNQVKQSKIDMLTIEYELFKMKEDKHIQEMHTRFTSIIN